MAKFCIALFAVKVRAEAMQKASDETPSGMLSVIGRSQANYKYACLQARDHCLSLGIKNPVCSIASYLFPDGRVIAGHLAVRTSPFRRSIEMPLDSSVYHTTDRFCFH